MNETATTTATRAVEDRHGYHSLERLIQSQVADMKGPLFTTDAANLFDLYLKGMPEQHWQHYNCQACRKFVDDYGGLVTIKDDGIITSLLWWLDMVPGFFCGSIMNMCKAVHQSRITGVFVSEARTWGRPENTSKTGMQWTHLHGTPNESLVWNSPLKTAGQRAAELREEYVMLKKAIAEFSMEASIQAVRVLEADALSRGEKTLGVAQWFLNLHTEIKDKASRQRDNLLWRTITLAPAGWCHVRSTMIGTLLQDVVDGLPYDSIARRWAEKMHPLQYRRPTAPPKEGNIKQAEELIAKLGSGSALDRRFARHSDLLNPLWLPQPEVEFCNWCLDPQNPSSENHPHRLAEHLFGKKADGVFDHLRKNAIRVKEVELPPRVLSWEKFRDEVLPDSLRIEVEVPPGMLLPFCGLVTAANPAAPPLLQWDGLTGKTNETFPSDVLLPRNPVSWYFYHGGSRPAGWNLTSGWVNVTAVVRCPAHWQLPEHFKHFGEMALFILADCRDTGTPGLALFSECLCAEYHGIRSVLEAHSQSRQPSSREDASAAGLALQKGGTWYPLLCRVQTKEGTTTYRIDRWE